MPSRVGSRPSRMFSATERFGASESSWWINRMPSRSAIAALLISTACAASSILPASARTIPPSTLIRVDLPAPFSPRSAWISPARRSKETPSSAATPPKRLVRLWIDSKGGDGVLAEASDISLQTVEELAGVAPVDELYGDLDVLGDGFAGEMLVRRLRRDAADLAGELGSSGMQLASLDRGAGFARPINRDHGHLAELAGRFDS